MCSYGDVDVDDSGDVESGYIFLFIFNDDWVIDVNYKGNDVCWINYSCDLNCEVVIEEDEDGDSRGDKVFIEVLCDIKVGEELIYNYGIILVECYIVKLKKIWECCCGLFKCIGIML